MSEAAPAISLRGVGKMYKVFASRFDNFVDAMGFGRVMPWRRVKYREFWALRGVDLSVPRGKRLGIIGCNGAGKTTLLKLLTGNLPPTEGTIDVRGRVHALMTTGAGFHPEFTGRENIEASLVYQGLSTRQIKEAIEEIADFTELEAFLDQPFKTYSAGMQARLTFATATTLTPDILIIDEILGAGDGYFIAKSTERITRLVDETGATVLLVSHALEQTVRFCEETIWLDRGRIVQRGPTLEVVKAYEQFLRVRNERRLKAKNKLRRGEANSRELEAAQLGLYNNHVLLRFLVSGDGDGDGDAACDIAEVTLRENGEVHEHVGVGDAQDTDTSRGAFVQFEECHAWSSPKTERDRHFRSVSLNSSRRGEAAGGVIFYLHGFFDDAVYEAEVTYRRRTSGRAVVEIWKDSEKLTEHELAAGDGEWTTQAIEITAPAAVSVAAHASGRPRADAGAGGMAVAAEPARQTRRAQRHWPSMGTLLIREVSVTDPNGQEQAVFTPGQSMIVRITVEAQERRAFPVRASVTVFRLDGVLVTRQQMVEPMTIELDPGATSTLKLQLPELNFGEGNFVFSVAVFGRTITEQDRYDLIDKAYEFQVVTSEPHLRGAIFHHPATWSVE